MANEVKDIIKDSIKGSAKEFIDSLDLEGFSDRVVSDVASKCAESIYARIIGRCMTIVDEGFKNEISGRASEGFYSKVKGDVCAETLIEARSCLNRIKSHEEMLLVRLDEIEKIFQASKVDNF